MGASVTGMDEILNNLNNALDKIEVGVENGVESAAEKIKRDAQSRAPIDTGTLRESAEVISDGTLAVVVFNAPYAVYVEADTPFLAPASLENISTIINTIKQEVGS